LKQDIDTLYQVHEFAELAGVTVRALHHYDRLGLLKPSRRSAAGYRLYGNRDLVRLEQIVVLKFLGLPLKQIRELLKNDSGLTQSLRRQRHVLSDKRRHLDSAIHAIETAERSLNPEQEPDWNLFKKIIKEIEMQKDNEWTKQYYSPEAQAKVEERKKLWSPELQEKVSKQWAELFADVESSLNEDPAGPKGQALAARWRELVGGFTGGNPEIQKSLNKMWSDQANWPEQPRRDYGIKPEIQAWIMKAMKK
jgi:MerR family transcriptional regulator, thiopeptide resistance regulator